MMTARPARFLEIAERGELRPGWFADIVLFDPARIIDHATYDDPHRYAEGVSHVIVNGVAVIDGGKLTGAKPGRPLRRQGWERR